MKKIFKFLFFAIITSGSLFYSCETTELENVTDPNNLTLDQLDPAFLFNNIQREYLFTVQGFNNRGGQLSRIEYTGSQDYFTYAGSASLNGAWGNYYGDMVPDIVQLIALDAGDPSLDLSYQIGIAKIMRAHVMMLLVDSLGDIVHSEAANPNEFPSPNLDDDATVYAAATAILNEGIASLNASTQTVQDLFFDGGSAANWIKVANTLMMRANLTQGNNQAVLDATNVISSEADDLQFWYGTNLLQPNNRHPDYNNDYTAGGGGLYRSNWLMNNMRGTWGDFFGDDDPRRRYYFYRQTAITPGNQTLLNRTTDNAFFVLTGAVNVQELECSGNSVFSHIQFTPEEDYWCSVRIGYWGRDHFNTEGTPPDNFTRTVVGVYPAGGFFDDHNDFMTWDGGADQNFVGYEAAGVSLGAGGSGAGIEPIMLSSYVDFMRAQAAMALNNTGMAATYLEAGMTKSVAKVQTFGALDLSGPDLSIAPDAAFVAAFVAGKVAEFNAAPTSSAVDANGFPVELDKMDILGEQYFTALYGGAADALNFIRLTGYPRTIARGWEPNRGLFPRTFLYPDNEVSTNPSINQRTDTQTQVFWDNGVTNTAN